MLGRLAAQKTGPMPFSKPYPHIAQNLSDRADTATAIRNYLLHPVTLLLFAFAPVLKLLHYMPLEFPMLGLWGDVAFYTLRSALYILLSLRFMPDFVPWLMARNVPFFYATLLFFILLATVNFVVFHSLMPRGLGPGEEALRLLRILLFTTFAHVIIMLMVRPIVQPKLGKAPELVPFYWPVPESRAQLPLAALIDGGLKGMTLSLQAQNQYVLVTTELDSHLVRMPLKRAIECLPPDSGMQVHRSWWISRTVLAAGRYDPALPAIFAQDERTQFPVGKTFVPAVSALFDARQTAGTTA